MAIARTAVQDRNAWVLDAVGRFEGPLVLYVTRLLGDVERAKDVVQDTFLRLCGQDSAELEGRLAEWLYTVARNRALDVLRKEGRMTRLSDELAESCESTAEAPSGSMERRESAERVLALVDSLPAKQREVVRLKFQHGFSYKEISRISGHSVSNVGFILHMAIKRIREEMALAEGRPAGAQS
jgi:RNA polymerase sigma-70 factor (ECF subfamily)